MWAYSISKNNTKFRRIAINALVRMLPDSDISNLSRQFEIMDTNHTCQLEHDELMEAVASAGLIHITSKDCHQMIKEINMTGSHTIFYTEFIAATLNLKKVLQQY
jgi:calcium-dependent protein kinase